MLRGEYVSAGPDTVLVRIPSGRPQPAEAELLVLGGESLLGRFDPLPDPPGSAEGGSWRGGFAVPAAVLAGASELRLMVDGEELAVEPPPREADARLVRELGEVKAALRDSRVAEEARAAELAHLRAEFDARGAALADERAARAAQASELDSLRTELDARIADAADQH